MMVINLNFINQSNDDFNDAVVIFQKNVASGFGEQVIAWTVIQGCAKGDNRPFAFPMSTMVNASDSFGNYSPPVDAEPGRRLLIKSAPSGMELVLVGPATSPEQLEVQNGLKRGATSAIILRDGRIVALEAELAPDQTAAFEFNSLIWLAVAPRVNQGEVLNPAIVSDATAISLRGIASADIVMTGGGAGPDSSPFVFTLQNVVPA